MPTWQEQVTKHFSHACYSGANHPGGLPEMLEVLLATIEHGLQHDDCSAEWRTENGVDGLYSDIADGYFIPLSDLLIQPTPGQSISDYLETNYSEF